MPDNYTSNTLVIGTGYWGKNIVRNLHELGALYGICDRDPEKLESFADQYPGLVTYQDLNQALEDEEVDNIAIATPAETHYEMATRGLEAGKHVFVEKPLALNFAQGEKLVRKAEETGLTLCVGHLLEYHPAVVKLDKLVKAGELGKIQYVYSNRLNLGKFRNEENILWSFAPHDIAVILRLIGGMPVEVASYGGSYLQPNIADTTVTNLVFDDGTRGHIFVSWLHPFKEQKMVVVGEEKMAVFNDTADKNKLMLYDQGADWVDGKPVPRRQEGKPVTFEDREPLKDECRAFLDAATSGERPVTDGYNGLRVLRVLQASQHSLQTGAKAVPIYESYESLTPYE